MARPVIEQPVRARMMSPRDGDGCTAWLLRDLAREPGSAAVPAGFDGLITRLLRQERLRGGCIETRLPDGRWQPLAFGLSTFASDAAAADFLAAPRPGIAAHFLQLASRDPAALLAPRGIAAANSGAGLNLMVLYFGIFSFDFAGEPLAALTFNLAVQHFLTAHRGFNLKMFLREDPLEMSAAVLNTGMMEIATFPAGTPAAVTGATIAAPRLLAGFVDPEAARQRLGSTIALLLHLPPAFIGFRPAECRLLALAADGLGDSEIADILELSPGTIKQTWRAIFQRVEDVAPFALGPAMAATGGGRGRGPEKRRHLINYLRDHPQEMRPRLRRPSSPR